MKNRGLLLDESGLRLVLHKMPEIQSDEDVIIQVVCAGICRSDQYLIDGQILPKIMPIIPGHEFSGFVFKRGKKSSLKIGQAVGILPFLSPDFTK